MRSLLPLIVAGAVLAVLPLDSAVAQKAPKRDPYTLTAEEIAATPDLSTAYDAVQRLRPRFLRADKVSSGSGPGAPIVSNGDATTSDPAGGDSRSQGIAVIVDGVRRGGGVAELRQIKASAVERISYLKAHEASGRYGADQSGVIEVTTRTP